jgi:hypothetical protein
VGVVNRDRNPDANSDSHAYCYSHSNSNCYGHPNRYSYFHAQTHAHTEVSAIAEGSSYSAAPAVIRLEFGLGLN